MATIVSHTALPWSIGNTVDSKDGYPVIEILGAEIGNPVTREFVGCVPAGNDQSDADLDLIIERVNAIPAHDILAEIAALIRITPGPTDSDTLAAIRDHYTKLTEALVSLVADIDSADDQAYMDMYGQHRVAPTLRPFVSSPAVAAEVARREAEENTDFDDFDDLLGFDQSTLDLS